MKRVLLLLLLFLSGFLANLEAGDTRAYGYYTNPYSVHRPYRPGYFNSNNYYYFERLCALRYGRGSLDYLRCMNSKP